MRLEYTALGVLLFSIASCVADYDATEDLYGHIVFFKHLDSSSWLGLTGDETMTIDIGEDDIRAYDPQLGLRNKFEKPASAPEFKIIENIMGIDDNGGDIANRPPRPSRNFFSGQELAEQLPTETNYLRDKNINPIQFWKHNKNETYSKDMQWRVMCADDSMENCTIMNVKYREFLFSYGKNASLGTKPACSESNIEDCPHECETNADCFDRGQCVTCQSNECRVWELCCDCLSCPCDELYGDNLEANAVCQKEMKCGLCGGHCADVTDPCPIVENPVCKPFDPPEPADPEPLGPPFRWKVIRPNFTSNEAIILDSGCNEREEEAYEVIPYWTGIVMRKNASWNWSDDVANDLLTRIENGDITGEGADKWMKEPDETWRMGESHHLPVTIPYAHKAVVKQLQGKYGNPSDPVYTVYGEVSLIQIKSCPLPLRPGCIDDEVGGHTPPECPMFPKHHWQYEPREVKFRPHDTDCSLYWECFDPKIDEEGVLPMRPYCLRRCGKFNHRSTTFDWGFGGGSMECVWDADCSYVNQTTPSEETTSPATTTEAVKPTVMTTVKSTTTAATTVKSTTSSSKASTISGLCSENRCDSESYYSTANCSETFCQCDNGLPVLKKCADGPDGDPLAFSAEHKQCVYRRQNPECDEYGKSRLSDKDHKKP